MLAAGATGERGAEYKAVGSGVTRARGHDLWCTRVVRPPHAPESLAFPGETMTGSRPPEPHDPQTQRKLLIALVIAFLFMIVEVVGGIYAHSLAIITDAAHLLSDVSGFGVSALAAVWAARMSHSHFSYGCEDMALSWCRHKGRWGRCAVGTTVVHPGWSAFAGLAHALATPREAHAAGPCPHSLGPNLRAPAGITAWRCWAPWPPSSPSGWSLAFCW